MFNFQSSSSLILFTIFSLVFSHCTFTETDCSPMPVSITGSSEMIITLSANVDETLIIDTFDFAPQYVKIILETDDSGICNPVLGNPLQNEDIVVTINKDFLINFNTLIPAYTNLFEPSFSILYDTRDYSEAFIPLNQASLQSAFFEDETVTFAYSARTEDGTLLSDSTTVVLDY